MLLFDIFSHPFFTENGVSDFGQVGKACHVVLKAEEGDYCQNIPIFLGIEPLEQPLRLLLGLTLLPLFWTLF